MIKIIPYLAYLFLIAFYQVILLQPMAILGVTVDLAGLIVLLVALYKSELISLWFGFAVGLVIAAGDPRIMGWQALILGALGMGAFHARQRFNLDTMWSRVLIVSAGVIAHLWLSILVEGGNDFLFRAAVYGLPGAVYTVFWGWLFLLVKERRITYQTVRELF